MKRSNLTPFVGVAPGLFAQCYGLATASLGWCVAGSLLLVAALTLLAIAKGYHPAWGFWGLVPFLGPLLLLIQPVRHVYEPQEELQEILLEEDPTNHPAPHPPDRIRGGKIPLLILAPASVVMMASLPFWHCDAPAPASQAEVTSAPVTPEIAPTQPANTPTLTPAVPAPPPSTPATTSPPTEAPAVEATTAPLPAPAPVPAPVIPKPPTPAELFEFNYAKIRMGMTEEEVTTLAGDDAQVVAEGVYKIVRWEGPGGLSFAARFQGGRMDGLTMLHRPPEQLAAEDLVAELMKKEAAATAQADRQQNETPEPAQSDAEEEPAQPKTEATAEEESMPDQPEPEAEQPQERSRVVVLEHPPQSSGRATYRNAKLPAYSIPLDHGPHDVVIKNPSRSALKVGIRSGKFGKDLTVGPGARAVVYLKNGQYSLFYIDPDEPEDLHESGSFSVQSPPGPMMVPLK